MNEGQAERIIDLLEGINSKLDYIESNTNNIDSNSSVLDDILKYVKRIYNK